MLDVKQEYLDELVSIFKNYCPNAEIWAYGSRVKNDSHAGSDLDLVVKDFNDENKHLYELKQLLYDSTIPFLIDIQEYKYMPEYFKTEINKQYIRIF